MILLFVVPILPFLLLWLDAPWWMQGIIGLPALLITPGWGWIKRFHRDPERNLLSTTIDSTWASLAILWINISIIREAKVVEPVPILLALNALWTYVGLGIGWKYRFQRPTPRREIIGIASVIIAILILGSWKSNDIARPLDGYWFHDGADDPRNELIAMRPGRNWAFTEEIGWKDAGAMRLIPQGKNPDLIATTKVNGRLTLAVRGDIGSYIEAGGQRATVEQFVTEKESEGPVRRYLDKGIASISVWVDMQPGEYFGLDVQGDEVYLIPSSDAVWSLHATGTLKYIHYYQILNQVENQVWAQEVLNNRRFTWNQPPGWSPILAASTLLVVDDLPAASMLFLWVLFLIGLSSVRLCSLISPYATTEAYILPGFFVLIHGQLMLLPASMNFPDSLYTAAILGIFIGLFEKNTTHGALMGFAAQALRWPGGVLATFFWFIHHKIHSTSLPIRFPQIVWGSVIIGGIIGGIATQSADTGKILEILYFETFPEHWHGNYNIATLLSRIPSFFQNWFVYTGGSLFLVIPFLFGPAQAERKALRTIFFSILPYSLVLATIDHHPSHYFLPLVACTGPMLLASVALVGRSGRILTALSIGGICLYLWNDFV